MSNEDSSYSHATPSTSVSAGEDSSKDTASIQSIPLPDHVTSATSIIAAPSGEDGSEMLKSPDETPTIKEPTPDPVSSANVPGVDDQDIDAMLREIGWESRGKSVKTSASATSTPRPGPLKPT